MIEVAARAKINWTLDILGKRADGYHELDMLMQTVTLADTLLLGEADELSLTIGRGVRMRPNEDNLVLRAARALAQHAGISRGAAITLEKRIPIGAGMGGGSADAAGVLVGLNALWGLGLGMDALERIGLTLGADVPFCVRGGLARATGVGEQLTPLNIARPIWLVSVQPCRGLSTRDVFGTFRLDAVDPAVRPDNDAAAAALAQGDLAALAHSMGNVLEPVAVSLRPEIGEALARLRALGAIHAQMTGSGSAVYGIFAVAKTARAAWDKMRASYRNCAMISTAQEGIVLRNR